MTEHDAYTSGEPTYINLSAVGRSLRPAEREETEHEDVYSTMYHGTPGSLGPTYENLSVERVIDHDELEAEQHVYDVGSAVRNDEGSYGDLYSILSARSPDTVRRADESANGDELYESPSYAAPRSSALLGRSGGVSKHREIVGSHVTLSTEDCCEEAIAACNHTRCRNGGKGEKKNCVLLEKFASAIADNVYYCHPNFAVLNPRRCVDGQRFLVFEQTAAKPKRLD